MVEIRVAMDPSGITRSSRATTNSSGDWIVPSAASRPNYSWSGSLTLNANNDPGAGTLTFTITGGPWIVEDWASGEGGGIADINMQHVIYDPGSSNPSYEVTITTMDIVSTEFDGKVSVTTTTPLEGNSDAPPTSGVLVITGGGESLEIDAAAPGCPRPADQYEVINRTYASGGTDCYDW